MFGRGRPRKVGKVIETPETEEETPTEESEEEITEEVEEKQQKPKLIKPVQIQTGKARIVEAFELDGGFFKFTLIANKVIGRIGEEFEI